MASRGYAVTVHEAQLKHSDSGIVITLDTLASTPSPPLIRCAVGVTASHPRFPPDGILEYQHGVAATEREAIHDGFDQWLQIDFPVLLDALRDQPKHCQALEWQWDLDGVPNFTRRALLGPVGHLVEQPQPESDATHHPSCPCCLLTNTFDAFQSLIQTDGFYAIRLLAFRDENGSTQADCRINGADWESGKRALCSYAATWPPAGVEMRKQYVVLQTVGSDRGSTAKG